MQFKHWEMMETEEVRQKLLGVAAQCKLDCTYTFFGRKIDQV
jgi:hypothetical protein